MVKIIKTNPVFIYSPEMIKKSILQSKITLTIWNSITSCLMLPILGPEMECIHHRVERKNDGDKTVYQNLSAGVEMRPSLDCLNIVGIHRLPSSSGTIEKYQGFSI